MVSVAQCTGPCRIPDSHIFPSAIQYIGSTPTAILGALEPVTAIIFGITIFGERMTLRESIGIVMILIAVTLVIAGGSITSYMVRFRKMFPRLPHRRS